MAGKKSEAGEDGDEQCSMKQVEQGDNSHSQDPTHKKPAQYDLINHSLRIEIHRACGAAARIRIDQGAAIAAGDKAHKLDLR